MIRLARLTWVVASTALLSWASGQQTAIVLEAGPEKTELLAPLPRSTTAAEGEVMRVDWVTVLDLARASSLEIQLAAERVNEADVQVNLARLQWIPSLKVGASWLNSAGRRQEIPGNIIEASKSSLYGGALGVIQLDAPKVAVDVLRAKQNVYAKSGELDRVSRAEIQKVSNAYIDLVAAQAGTAVSLELSGLINELAERVRQLKEQGFGTDVDVLRSQVALQSQIQQEINAYQNELAASAQLVMLLNLDPSVQLSASWDHLAPITLVDENQPEEVLIEQARGQGPGIAEVAALLNALDEQQRQLRRIGLIPTIQIDSGLGAFGGGEGSDLGDFGDRTDVGVHAYWDVMKVVGTRHAREMFNSKRRQALLEQEKLLGRLAAGVKVARHRSIQAKRTINAAEKQVELAIQSYALSKKRMDALLLPAPALEILPAIAALGQARGDYIRAVIEYNKAQVELMYLLGQHVADGAYHQPNCPPKRYVDGLPVGPSRDGLANPRGPEVEIPIEAPVDRAVPVRHPVETLTESPPELARP